MSCAGCARKITAALENVPGVVSAAATFNPPEARLEMSGQVSTDVLNRALGRTGAYRLAETRERQPEAAGPTAESRQSLYPLYLIVGYIAGTVGLVALSRGDRSVSMVMNN